MKKFVLVAVSVFIAAIFLSAAPLTVSWADGKVDKQQGSTWLVVNMGDTIDSSDTLRLGPGASVEIIDGKRKVSLTAAGTYPLDSILRKGAVSVAKKSSALDKLGKLVDPKASTSASTVAAVRGAAVEPGKETMTWASDSGDVASIMEAGRQLVRDGNFIEAALKFGDAAYESEGDEKDAAIYAQAWALAAADSSAQAVKLLRGMTSSGVWAAPRVLLLARLDIDSGAKDEAKVLLGSAMAAKLFAGDDVELSASLLAEANAE